MGYSSHSLTYNPANSKSATLSHQAKQRQNKSVANFKGCNYSLQIKIHTTYKDISK